MKPIKAISLWQPWGSLWLSPAKRHETRHWSTSHRGLLLVHAAKKIDFDIGDRLEEICDGEFGNHWGMDLPRGFIIGAVKLVDVIPTEKLYTDRGDLTEDEECDLECGNFADGRFAWRRDDDYCRFACPIPYRGHQSLFDVPADVVAGRLAAAGWPL